MAWNQKTVKPDIGSRQPSTSVRRTLVAIGAVVSFLVLAVVIRRCATPPSSNGKATLRVALANAPARACPKEVTCSSKIKAPVRDVLAVDERRTVTGKIIKIPKNPFGTPIPKDLEYKAIWEYTPEDYARVDPGYAERHEQFLKAQAANPWKTPADKFLSMLLFSKDGNMGLLIPFDAQFKEKFLKSLETPIIVSRDDPPELQEQKRQMIEAKAYLKEKMDGGEDIVKILNDEYEFNKKMAGKRENMMRNLRELEKTATSVQEVQEYVDAANAILEQEGAGRIHFPLSLTRYRLLRQNQEEGGKRE